MKNLTENNRWALVTGASGGVGKEIAKILETSYVQNIFPQKNV